MAAYVPAVEHELQQGGLRRRLNAQRCRRCISHMCFSFVEGALGPGLLEVPFSHWARCEGCGTWEPDCTCPKGRVH